MNYNNKTLPHILQHIKKRLKSTNNPDNHYEIMEEYFYILKERKGLMLYSSNFISLCKEYKVGGEILDKAKKMRETQKKLRREWCTKETSKAKANNLVFKSFMIIWIFMLIGLNIYIALK